MSINHGGDRGTSPQEFGVADDNENCPQDFAMLHNFKHQNAISSEKFNLPQIYLPWEEYPLPTPLALFEMPPLSISGL